MSLFSCFFSNLFRAVLLITSLFACAANATTVQFQTVMGNIEVNLFDTTTPETVSNFLAYVNSGAYNNSIIHRSVRVTNTDGSTRGFVVQGGQYTYDGAFPLKKIVTSSAVKNEPVYSNLRGTIAMAKISGKPDSATSQWFFNLHNDNAAALDSNNGGFTVFGQVTAESLPVLDAMNAENIFSMGAELAELPLRNYTVTDYQNNALVDDNNLILVTAVLVLNASPDTASGLNPTKNTLLAESKKSGGGGGGSLGFIELSLLLILFFMSRKTLLFRRK